MVDEAGFDVLIVGAGPAGAFLGYLLASRNFRVLIIDSKLFPRHKSCGGGLTRRAHNLLPFDVSAVSEDHTRTAQVTLHGETIFRKTLRVPFITMVMRNRFDALLMEHAVNAGALFRQETRFLGLQGSAGDLKVCTSRGIYSTRVVVGADGFESRVAKALGLRDRRQRMIALEGEVFPANPDTLGRYRGTAHFDFGHVPGGYGWIFPKKDHLSVGVLTVHSKIRQLKALYGGYLEIKGLHRHTRVEMLKGHGIPYGPVRAQMLTDGKGLLVGDAAGLCDPVTGEGIYHALRASEIAAGVISSYLAGELSSLRDYGVRLKNAFAADMVRALWMNVFLYRCSLISHKMLRTGSRTLLGKTLQIVSGEKTYRQEFTPGVFISQLARILGVKTRLGGQVLPDG